MADDPIRSHIRACSARSADETSGHTSRILDACWPGGADRSQPGALDWVRRWRPERIGASLPACSCAAGRCIVCN